MDHFGSEVAKALLVVRVGLGLVDAIWRRDVQCEVRPREVDGMKLRLASGCACWEPFPRGMMMFPNCTAVVVTCLHLFGFRLTLWRLLPL